MGEILGVLLGTYLATRLGAWGFTPTARRAVFAAATASFAVPWIAIALIHFDSSESNIAQFVILCGLCIGLWLAVDLWRVRRFEMLKLAASERYMAREAQRLKVEPKWALAVVTAGPKSPSSGDRCGACGVAVPHDAKFCDSCGGVVSNRCLKCGAANRDGARFCKQCGDPLPGAQGAERDGHSAP